MTDLSVRDKRRTVVESRTRPFAGAELRAMDDGAGGNLLRFSGYASVTEAPYEMEDWLGAYTEVVRAGAFAKTLSEGADVAFKVNHGGLTLARTKCGTMRLAEDSTGLHVEADLDSRSPAVQTLRSAMDRGDVDEMSFAFRVTRQEWSPDYTQRDITEVSLAKGDVSVVNYGANPATAGATLRGRDVVQALTALRSGAALTPDAMETLGQVLRLISADDAALASVLGDDHPNRNARKAVDLSAYSARLRALDI